MLIIGELCMFTNFIWCDMHSLMPVGFLMLLSMNDFLPGFVCLFVVFVVAVVVIKCFMIGVNVWWLYLPAQNIPRANSVLTLGNKVILYCIFTYKTITNNYIMYTCIWINPVSQQDGKNKGLMSHVLKHFCVSYNYVHRLGEIHQNVLYYCW